MTIQGMLVGVCVLLVIVAVVIVVPLAMGWAVLHVAMAAVTPQ